MASSSAICASMRRFCSSKPRIAASIISFGSFGIAIMSFTHLHSGMILFRDSSPNYATRVRTGGDGRTLIAKTSRIALPFRSTRGMNRHARISSRKDQHHDERRSYHHSQSGRRRCGTGRAYCVNQERLEEGRQQKEERAKGQEEREVRKTCHKDAGQACEEDSEIGCRQGTQSA